MRVPMVVMKIALTVLVLCSGTAVAGDASADEDKAAPCLQCHNAVVSLKDRGADVIAAQIQAIRAGDVSHPPGLAGLTDDEIEAIAAWLDGA